MCKLIHEIWEFTDDGMILQCCCLAGPGGEECRQSLGESAKLLSTFEAGSHFEAMTIYNRFLGREEYRPISDEDFAYPKEWYHEQKTASDKKEIKQ